VCLTLVETTPGSKINKEISPKKKYNKKEHEFFSDMLKAKLRRTHRAGYKELDHPKLDHPELDYDKILKERKRHEKEMEKKKQDDKKLKALKVAEACEPSSIAPGLGNRNTVPKQKFYAHNQSNSGLDMALKGGLQDFKKKSEVDEKRN
jgi:hypothetical protein